MKTFLLIVLYVCLAVAIGFLLDIGKLPFWQSASGLVLVNFAHDTYRAIVARFCK